MGEVTIVTAFFDIGRGNSSTLKRTNEQYFEYFKFWARMQNHVICYTNPAHVETVRAIRALFGLLERTTVIAIEDISALEPEIYASCIRVSSDKRFRASRLFYRALSNNAAYSYSMFLKHWCLADAQKRMGLCGTVAWLDFGFNHGGKTYPHPEDFDFLWCTDFPQDKIHVFALNNSYLKPLHLILRSLEDSMQGSIVIMDAALCAGLYAEMKQAFGAILSMGQLDDDQAVLCLAYQNNPGLFCVHHTYWHLGLKEHGGAHLRVKPGYGQQTPKWLVNYLRNCLRFTGKKIGFLLRFTKELAQMPVPLNCDEIGEGGHD